MNKSIRILVIAVVATVALAWRVSAQDKAKAAAEPSPQEKAAMEAMMKAGSPGEAHKKLEPLVGTFDAKVTSWMDPSKPPIESSGIAENKWVLGNRYVEQKFQGSFMEQPFHGIGYTGYDNVANEYVSVWMDSMSTAMMVTRGTAAGNSVSQSGSMLDPMTRKPATVKTKFTMADADHHIFDMWAPAPDGTMVKVMEIAYTRKK